MDALRDNNEADAMLEKFKQADQMLNKNLNLYLQFEGSSSDKSLNNYAFTRSSLDEHLIQDIKKHIIMLHEVCIFLYLICVFVNQICIS